MLLVGNKDAQAVVRVVSVDDDGQVHFVILPGSLASNQHLLRKVGQMTGGPDIAALEP